MTAVSHDEQAAQADAEQRASSTPAAQDAETKTSPVVDFDVHPDNYHHWHLSVDVHCRTEKYSTNTWH